MGHFFGDHLNTCFKVFQNFKSMQEMINLDNDTWMESEETVSGNLLALQGVPVDMTEWKKWAEI